MEAPRNVPMTPTGVSRGMLVRRLGALTVVLVVTALVSEADDWQPLRLVIALAVLYAIADPIAVRARRVRLSAGLTVQTTTAALLGPGPAVALSLASNGVDSLVNRLPVTDALTNMAMIPALGLVGGVLFEVAGGALGLDREMPAYAALVPPIYLVVFALNVVCFAAVNPWLAGLNRRRVLRETAIPMIPWEILNCVLATAVVLAWALSGIGAAAGLLVALVVTVPLLHSLGAYVKTSDDLVSLQEVSDRRAAEVERLSSDRDRLLTEVLHAERRERARLAESLHDGPLQRMVALRQDAAESAPSPPERVVEQLDAAIAETRAIISAFHPEAVREQGFEASLRAAVAPFPSARHVKLSVRGTVTEGVLTETLLLPLAQELLVNAFKHARPTAIEVSVTEAADGIVLEVSDDGVGIDASGSDRTARAGHVGLAVVRRRVQDAGGTFEIATRDDGGTRSRAVLPPPAPAIGAVTGAPEPARGVASPHTR
jgi:signal transduction histidine kinase